MKIILAFLILNSAYSSENDPCYLQLNNGNNEIELEIFKLENCYKDNHQACECADKEAKKYLFDDSETKDSLKKRMSDFLIDQAKVNLLEYLNTIDYMEAMGSSIDFKDEYCSLKDLDDPKNFPSGCNKNASQVLSSVKRQFQNEVKFRMDASFPQDELLFSREDAYKQNNDVEKPSCKISEKQAVKIKSTQDKDDFKNILKIIKAYADESDRKIDYEHLSIKNQIIDEYFYENDNFEGADKFKQMMDMFLNDPVYSNLLTNPKLMKSLVDNLDDSLLNQSIDSEIGKIINSKKKDSLCYKVKETKKELIKAACVDDDKLERFIPNDYDSFKNMYPDIQGIDSNNQEDVANKALDIVYANNDLNFICKRDNKGIDYLPKELKNYLVGLDSLKLDSRYNSFETDTSQIKDGLGFQNIAKTNWRNKIHKTQKNICDSLDNEKMKLASMDIESYGKCYARDCDEDDCQSRRDCLNTAALVESFPDMYRQLKESYGAASSDTDKEKIEINFTPEKKGLSALEKFAGMEETETEKAGRSLAMGKVKAKVKENVEDSKSSSSKPTSVIESRGRMVPGQGSRKGLSRLNSGRNFKNTASLDPLREENNILIDKLYNANKESFEKRIKDLENVSTPRSSAIREIIEQTKPSVKKEDRVSTAQINNINKPIANTQDTSLENTGERLDQAVAECSGGQFCNQDPIDQAIEDAIKSFRNSKGAKSGGSAGAGGASGSGVSISGLGASSSSDEKLNVFEFDEELKTVMLELENGEINLDDKVLVELFKSISIGQAFMIKSKQDKVLATVIYEDNGFDIIPEQGSNIAIQIKKSLIRSFSKIRKKVRETSISNLRI